MSILNQITKSINTLLQKILGVNRVSSETQKVLLYLLAFLLVVQTIMVTQAILLKWLLPQL